jgi:hypothetical protein
MSRDSSVARKGAEESVPSTNPSDWKSREAGHSGSPDAAGSRRAGTGPGQSRDSGFGGRSEFQRDVLKAMGMYPGLEGSTPLGGECSGTVVAVGSDVEAWLSAIPSSPWLRSASDRL